ncbi:MAG: adenosylcobalamin-dependent ribonucleoside-diphosphate reductase [Gammaproteobacteria bacterium]|nr:adenosylcobalamin-dependent ribonucleoside-diphosphate reductase [Gammaproteobacteria bacterium]
MSRLNTVFNNDVSRLVWETKYRYSSKEDKEESILQSWRRVANHLASVEKSHSDWPEHFYTILNDFRFLPGGRILAGAGLPQQLTLFNCFVMGEIEDSIDGIFDALKESALTMQQGGGVGCDFSNLRPKGTHTRRVGSIASGPVSFMHIWDSMCATLLSTGVRRGAMMATLRCDHPDIEQFIQAKRNPDQLRHFNLSVLVTDAFMEAVKNDHDWPLVFPVKHLCGDDSGEILQRFWHSQHELENCKVIKVIRARQLWDKIIQASYDYAEPGVLFIDQINRSNNLNWCEHISATNPCGEIPLPAYGACNLGSINLTRFVSEPYNALAKLDFEGIIETAAIATRLMDNVVDVSHFPMSAQQQQAQATRRLGLGITGLADTLLMLGLQYGSETARHLAAEVMQCICHTAYRTSIKLAKEKGSFPLLNKEKFLATPFIKNMPEDIQQGIRDYGIRNSHLTAIAPTGTISLLANNISSGIEPVFESSFQRRVLINETEYATYNISDYACHLWQEKFGQDSLPGQFITAQQLPPVEHLKMQAAIQPYIDNAISKTINIPCDYDFTAYQDVYQQAYELGLKGCTTFRPNPVTGSILSVDKETSHCCGLERETD